MKVFKKLKRAISYFIHGWSSYDWDNGFLLKDILFKLKRMDTTFSKEDFTTYNDKQDISSKSLKLAIKLLDRHLNHEYTENVAKFELNAGKVDFNFSKDGVQMVINGIPANETNRSLFHEAYSKDRHRSQRDLKLFFDIFVKYQDYWWS